MKIIPKWHNDQPALRWILVLKQNSIWKSEKKPKGRLLWGNELRSPWSIVNYVIKKKKKNILEYKSNLYL